MDLELVVAALFLTAHCRLLLLLYFHVLLLFIDLQLFNQSLLQRLIDLVTRHRKRQP